MAVMLRELLELNGKAAGDGEYEAAYHLLMAALHVVDHLAHQLDYSDMEGLRKMPFGALAHAPRQGQSAPLIDHVEHQRQAATADDTAIHDHHKGL